MKKFILYVLILVTAKVQAQPTQYAYDNLYRLTSVKYANGSSIAYLYDDNGNRTQEVYNDTYVSCPGNNISYNASNRSATSYQWQEDNGTGYSNISNSVIYDGTTNATLTLNSPPSNWYGKKYRCLINGNSYSQTYVLKFAATWLGSSDTNWHNPSNWSCGSLPDINTDVVISQDASRFPVVAANAQCKSLMTQRNTSLKVNNGVKLNIKK